LEHFMKEFWILYFEKSGANNTKAVLQCVKTWTEKLNIQTVLVATTRGITGALAAEQLQSGRVIAVTHSSGFHKENKQELTSENRSKIESFGGPSRALRLKFNTIAVDDLIANTLRIFGQGMKVAVEITLMAADAGLIDTAQNVIAVGGTGYGADTAVVIKPANVSRFFDLKVRHILCMPQEQ
jgi:hypothetical protein